MILDDFTLRNASCDADCSLVVLTGPARNGASISIVGGRDRPWSIVTDENGQHFLFLDGPDARQLVGVRKNDIVEIDLEKARYKVLYSHTGLTWYPRRFGKSLFFSDSVGYSPRTVNKHPVRRLFHYDLDAQQLRRLLVPWQAGDMHASSLLDDGRLCLSMILPRPETEPMAADKPYWKRYAYCFTPAARAAAAIDEATVAAAVPPEPWSDLELLRIDPGGQRAFGYTVRYGLGAYVFQDLRSQQPIRRIAYERDLAVGPSGNLQRYVQVRDAHNTLTGSVHDARTGATVSTFAVAFERIPTRKLTRSP